MNELRLVLVFTVIGQKIGVHFLSQLCSVISAKPITFGHSNENHILNLQLITVCQDSS